MKFEPFELERWLSERFKCDIDLSASVLPHLRYTELISEKDLDLPVRIGPTNGQEALREEIRKLYSESVDADGVLVTHGAAEANFLLLNHLLRSGDECIYVVPNYVQVFGILKAIGAKIKLAHLDEETGYRPNLDELNELTSNHTKAIILTNPNNPTGAKLSRDELTAICDLANDLNAYVIADEVLSGLEIDERQTPSPVDLYEKGISTRSLSKLGLSGLRIGWIATRDPSIAKGCWAIKDYTSLGNSFFNQQIALAAFRTFDWILQRDRKILRDRREILMSWVEENKQFVRCRTPEAGSTALVRYKFDMDSIDFCRNLTLEKGVGVSPGDFFKAPQGFRILYGTDANKLRTGLERITHFVETL